MKTKLDLAHWLETIGEGAKNLHDYFDRVEVLDPATGYEERNTEWFEQNILPDFLNTKKRLNLGPVLLDIGCADGFFTCRYAEHFEHVIGIDFSERRIVAAKKYNARNNVDYLLLDITEQGLNDINLPKINSAITSAVIPHIALADRIKAFKTISFLLGPEKQLIMYDERFQDRPELWTGYYEPLSPEWINSELKDSWVLNACDFVSYGLKGEHIHRYELSTKAVLPEDNFAGKNITTPTQVAQGLAHSSS